jgi:hypothetical protein
MSMRYFIACLGLVLTLAHCQSTQSRSRDVFSSILADAQNLRVNRSADVAKYQSLVDRLTQLRAENETYAADADNAARAAAFLGGYPSLKCAVAFAEPEETLLVTRGYASPVTLSSNCDVDAPFIFEADSTTLMLAPADVEFNNGHLVARIRVNSAANTSAKNILEISGHYYVEGLLRQVQKDFELTASPKLTFEPASFTLKGQPVANAYTSHNINMRAAYLTTAAAETDRSIEASVSSSGQLTLGGSLKGEKFDLIYGHPNGVLPDGIGTSFTTIRVDGVDFRLENHVKRQERNAAGEIRSVAEMPGTGITITQVIQPKLDNGRSYARITYEIENNQNRAHRVGVRLLLDTWTGDSDGAAFVLPDGGEHRLFTGEVEFTPTAAVLWQTVTNTTGPRKANATSLQGVFVGEGLVPPDRLAFVNWGEAVKTTWSYAFHNRRRVTGDTGILMWWEPQSVSANAKTQVATAIEAMPEGTHPVVYFTDPKRGEMVVLLRHANASKQTQHVEYDVTTSNGVLFPTKFQTRAEILPGELYTKAFSAQINSNGTSTITIKETIGEDSRTYTFPISNLKNWKQTLAAPVTEPGKPYSINYFDQRDMKLQGRLRNSAGTVIQTINLDKLAIEGGYHYSGKFEMPVDMPTGRHSIEVVR